MKYIYIGVSAFLVSIAITVLFLFYGQRVIPDGNDKALVYFIILIPLGICCAYLLFRVVRSYAHFKGTYRNQTLEVSGPAVMFLLVVGIGYYFVRNPPLPPTFTLTITFKDSVSLKPLQGNANISYAGSYYPSQKIDEGQVKFSNKVSTGHEITIEPDIPGYELNGNKVFKVPGNNESLDIKLTKKENEQASKNAAIKLFRSYVNDYDTQMTNFADFLKYKVQYLFDESDTAYFHDFVTLLNDYNTAFNKLYGERNNLVSMLSTYMPEEKDRVKTFLDDVGDKSENIFQKFNDHADKITYPDEMKKMTKAEKNKFVETMHSIADDAHKWIAQFERRSDEIVQKLASL
ncbi:MAG: hypothetical protein C5B52_03140 [Bacteroidetes bacterium]|nr:MAG: hypothetical protein C5B52_03140 [Bacteroidota bacterium]